MPKLLRYILRMSILAATVALPACLTARADTIDHLTLTTSAYGATNVTAFTFVEGMLSDVDGFSPVTIDSDPTKTGQLYYFSGFFHLVIYAGPNPVVAYLGISTLLGDSGREGDDDNTHYLKVHFKPGSYALISPSIALGSGGTLSLDSATVDITQDVSAVKPIFPVAPPPVAVAVTPELSTIVLLGTGLVGLVGAVKRRVRFAG